MALDPTRKRIAFLAAVRDETGEFRREILVHETSTVRRLHVFEPDERPESLRWSPDGRRIAIDLPEERADLFVWESKGRSGA